MNLRKNILLEVMLLTESKVDDIYNKFYSEIERETFDEIVSADPTSIKKDSQITKIGKFSKWLLNLYDKSKLKLEDLYKATQYLDTLNRKASKLKKDDISTDINKYKSLPDLFKTIKPYMDLKNISDDGDSEVIREIKQNETEVVYEDSEWKVLIPKTHRSSCYWGIDTEWCTATEDNDRYFESYSSGGNLYININKQTGQKLQFHFEENQFMDEEDDQIDLESFIYNNPELRELYYNLEKDNLDVDIGLNFFTKDNKTYLKWDGINDNLLGTLFNDYYDYTSDMLNGDGYKYFESDYTPYWDTISYNLTNETEQLILNKYKKYYKDNYDDILSEFDVDGINDVTLDEFVQYDENNDEEILDAVKNAYNNAYNSANEGEAMDDILNTIYEYLGVDSIKLPFDGGIVDITDSDINPINIFWDRFFKYSDGDETYLDDELKSKEPHYGYQGEIDKNYLHDEILFRLSLI